MTSVRLALAARPENVALVREVLAGVAGAVALRGSIDDVKTAVSEACNNVVVHAYAQDDGPLEVAMIILADELEVRVRDRGSSAVSREAAEARAEELMGQGGPGRGLGIAVMDALADSLEFRALNPHGLEVALGFELESRSPYDEGADVDGELEWIETRPEAVALVASPASLGSIALPRLACAAAARAGFTIDRVSDAQLLADAIAAHSSPRLSGARLFCRVWVRRHEIELEVGPFVPGGSRAVIADSAVGRLGPLLERLTDRIEVRESDATESLALFMRDDARQVT